MTKRVVTGQQIGLLGGPLYTAYKVLGAVRRGVELSGESVYWLETNDADFNEINHVDFLDSNGQLRTLTWDIDSRGYSCGWIEIDVRLTGLLEEFFASIRQTEFTPSLKELALDCYRPGRTLGEASLALAHELYGELPLRLFDPMGDDFRTFSRRILIREAEKTPVGDQCHLFVMDGKRRRAIFRTADGYRFRDGERVTIDDYPLVPSLWTRSVCQDAFFATDEYIAGPGEVRYLNDMTPQYEFHGVKPAKVIPRMSVTLVEPRVVRWLDKVAVSPLDVVSVPREELTRRLLLGKSGIDVKRMDVEARELTGRFLQDLDRLGLDTGNMRKDLLVEIKAAVGRRRALEKERHRELLRTIDALYDALLPFGKRQERVFNVFYYMNLYGGKDFIRWLYRRYDWQAEILEVSNA